ncbi:AAWKG family protein [Streptomyces sp. MUM 178J]|uniref:AAWKG family protein n=1 Tax=Streptomyces sp. MUM 178J TaxID=2791991 RepID=UPI001F0497AF|nr:AAWKG family protein [Streptomyces sp. MUM 178J]WRQ81513.1 AAWKG family protein [Streptomyces sp. MUM 178J]
MPEDNVIPLTSDNDAWQRAVQLFTGYKAPERHTLFDTLLGNEGIKQMKVEISKQGRVDYVDPDDFNWRVDNAGYRIENTDFVIPFYMTRGDDPSAGDGVSMYKARITMLGNKSHDGPPAGGVVEGGEFKSQYEKHLDLTGDKATWTTAPLTQYAYGTGRALEALLNNENGTYGFSWNSVNVVEEQAVTLKSFDTAAAAFDRVAQFFANRQQTIAEWQRRVGAEQDDAWRGQAAGVFWHLIDTLNRQYEGFAKDMGGDNGRSKQGNELREARSAFRNAVLKLHSSWAHWELYMGNPLRWLHDLLVEITDHVWENNIKQITYKVNPGYGPYSSPYTTYHAQGGFDQTATRFGKSDNFGPLDQLDTWKAVGDRAVENWQASVIENLVDPANAALEEIHNKWSSKSIDLGSVKVRGDEDLTSSYTEDKNEKEKEEADKAIEEANKKNDEFIAWQKEQAENAKAEQEEKEKEAKEEAEKAKAEQEKKEQEAKAEQEAKERAAKEEAAAAKAEQEQKEQEAKAEQEAKERAAKEEAAAAKAEQEQKEQEAKAEQEKKEQEAKAEQEAKEREAEAKQAEAEEKAEQRQAEQEQKQEEAQRKQEEAQARAEQLQISQFNQARADQEAARKRQEEKEAEAKAEQEAKEREAEAKQAEAEAEAEQKEAEARAEQEAREKEAEAKQAEAEAKAEERLKEQEAKQAEAEARAEEEQKKQEEEQRRLRTEQELRQEQLLTEQEKREAEQLARQEEAEKRQEEAWQQAQAAYQQSTEGLLNPGGVDLPGSGGLDTGGLDTGGLDTGGLNSQPLDRIAANPYSGDTLANPGGSSTTLDETGRLVTEYPDGSSVRIDPDLRTATVTQPDGTVQTGPLNVGDLLPNPDGSVTHLDSDGNIVTEYPDGTTTTVNPHTGVGTTTRPDGTVSSGNLNGALGDLPSGSGSGSGSYGSPSSRSPAYDYGSYEEELYDESPYESPYATSASTGAAASAADIGTPLNAGSLPGGVGMGGAPTGGMPMGGMPMGGMPMGGTGGGGNQGQSERVRNVIDDAQAVSSRGGRYGGSPAPRTVQDENDVRVSAPRASATTGSSPFLPMGGAAAPGGQPQTQSGDRAREVWAQEDDDVWGTDEGGAPAVIGR